jgi:hypothetical protein
VFSKLKYPHPRQKVSCLPALVFLFIAGTVSGQDSNYNFTVQTLGGYTTPGVVPFWLRANQFGSIPLDGASLSFIGAARKDYDLASDKLFDWGASFEGRANMGDGSNLTLIEGYGKVRLGVFELRAGRSKEIMGLCDTALSLGSWAVSGTNLGIPEIEVSVPEFFTIPLFGRLFAFKGNYSHGWMGNVSMNQYWEPDTAYVKNYFHQVSLYGRFGKPSWRMKLYGGFNHQAIWCNGQEYYNDDFTLSFFQTYLYVITGKRYSNGSIQSERLGDHLGSIDIGFEYEFDKVRLLLYRQNLYDAGALAHLANIQDGLNGVSLENKNHSGNQFNWKKLIIEFLYTKNQAGEPWSPPTGTQFENYYNHGQYFNGWSYQGTGLGNPFITIRSDAREELPSHPRDYFINNRVYAIHFGGEGTMIGLNYIIKASWSGNYGTYRTTNEEQSTDIPDPGAYGLFGEQNQLSTYLELTRALNNGINLGIIGAFDYGDLFYNSFGVFLKASYFLNLPKYSTLE